jgi:hypothetical protein
MLLDLIKFLFQDIWHWLGGLIYLCITAGCLVIAISEFKPIKITKDNNKG